MAVELREYQRQTLDELCGPNQTKADLVVCATGGGKTLMFAGLLDRELQPGQRALVLAHRDELIDQAVEKIAWVAPSLVIEREKAEQRANRVGVSKPLSMFTPASDKESGPIGSWRGVVVASVQTLRGKRLEEWPRDAFDIVICDEAHHATAPSYVAIFDWFTSARRIGFTATPSRTDGKPLGDVFERIAVDFGIRQLVQRGWLVPVAARVVRTDTDLSTVKQSAGDYAQGELEDAVNTDARNALMIAALQKYGEGRQTIIYCAGVEHARELAAMLTAVGIPTEAIYGAMPIDERKRFLQDFRDGRLQALTNFGVLTEGFDEPKVGCIVLGRPTQSVLLLTQMVGRGTRPLDAIAKTFDASDPLVRREMIAASAKPNVLVIDIQDVTHRMQATAATLAGLPAKFDAEGDDVFRAAEEMDKLDPRLVARCMNLEQMREMLAKVAAGLSVSEIDVLAATALDPAVEAYSRFVWASTGPDHFGIKVGEIAFSLSANTLGTYVLARQRKGSIGWVAVGEPIADVAAAFKAADAYIAQEFPGQVVLLDAGAKWRTQGPSEKQIDWLIKKGCIAREPGESESALRARIGRTVTKGQASQMLDAAFARGGGGRRAVAGGRR